jgi:hypothetical protein
MGPLVFILIVVLVAALGVGGFFAYQKFLAPAPPQPAAPAEQQAAVEQPQAVTPQPEQPPMGGQPAASGFEQPAPPRSSAPMSSPARGARPSTMTPPKAAASAPVASTPPTAAPGSTPSAAPAPTATVPAAEHPKRVEILKPETPIPQEAPRPAAQPAKASYSGPPAGVMLWSGQLEKNGSVTINGKTASFGNLTGELPGVPVMIEVDQREFALAESPGPSNGWKRMTIRSRSKRHSVVTIKWSILK